MKIIHQNQHRTDRAGRIKKGEYRNSYYSEFYMFKKLKQIMKDIKKSKIEILLFYILTQRLFFFLLLLKKEEGRQER